MNNYEVDDYEVDDNDDLKIDEDSGDFIIGKSTKKHQRHLLIMQKGDQRLFPFVGVGIFDYLLDDELASGALKGEIQKQEELDGRTVSRLDIFDNGEIEIDSSYEDDIG